MVGRLRQKLQAQGGQAIVELALVPRDPGQFGPQAVAFVTHGTSDGIGSGTKRAQGMPAICVPVLTK